MEDNSPVQGWKQSEMSGSVWEARKVDVDISAPLARSPLEPWGYILLNDILGGGQCAALPIDSQD